jgi:hypothetical protein
MLECWDAGMLGCWKAGMLECLPRETTQRSCEAGFHRGWDWRGSRFSGSTVSKGAYDDIAVGAKNLSPGGVTPDATQPGVTTYPTVNREPLNR